MKKILFLLVLLCAMAQGTWAQQEFITDVVVIGCNDDDDVDWYYGEYQKYGWIGIRYDLNNYAGGHYVYLMFKTNKSPGSSGTAINDLYLHVTDNYYPWANLYHNDRTYYLAGCDGDSDFITLKGDLNCKAGGAYIYLYYTKDLGSIARVTSITFNGTKAGAVGENGGTTPCDLNKGAGGSDIFMHIERKIADGIVDIHNEAELHEAALFDDGNLRLVNDINLSRAVGITGGGVTLDLNGKTLNRGLKSAQDLGSVIGVDPLKGLTINDSSDNPDTPEYDGTGTITGGYTNGDGGGICNYGFLTINGANIKGNAAKKCGGGIFTGKLKGASYDFAYGVEVPPAMQINSGVIENCTSDGNGGAICQGNYVGDGEGEAYINNCIIRNNVSKKGGGAIFNECKKVEVTNCTISVNTAFDTGGIYSKYGIVTVTGCTVTGNIGTDGAGGIANETTSAYMTVTGCTVTDNFAGTRGGGLWNSGTLSLEGNTITDNIAKGNGGGIYNATTLNMKGKPVVTGNTGNDTVNNLYLDNSSHITVTGAFTKGTSIGISMANKNAAITSGYTTHNAGKDPASIFTSDNGYTINLKNNEVYQYFNSAVATEAEIQDAVELDDAIITLTADITLLKQLTINAGRTVTIDLNGHKLQRNVLENDYYNMVVHNFGTLTVTDGSGTNSGQISGGCAHGGGGIYCEDGSKLTFNSGTITGNTVTTPGGIGGGLFVQHGSEVTINGGVITGNRAAYGGGVFVAAKGKLTINGGSITGNTATYNGGGIYYEANGTLNMKGNPLVSGNTGNGSDNNLYFDAGTKINVTGAFTEGASIDVSVANINTTITSGYTTHNAGTDPATIFKGDVGTEISLKDNEVYLGVAKNVDVTTEAQLYVAVGMDSHITLADEITLTKQLTINAGRTITVDLNGHKLQRNVTEYGLNNMVIQNAGTLTIDDGSGTNSGQITGGRATNGGGICCEAGSTLTFTGGTITGNTASNTGGAIYVKDGATATVTGGVITGNTAHINGGGIYVEGTLNMKGKPIVSDNHNGTALNNVYLPSGKTVNVTGAFTTGASIGISAANTGVAFTSGYKTHNQNTDPATIFTDDNEGDDAKITLIDNEVYLTSTKDVNVATYAQLMAAVTNNANIKLTADITLTQEVNIQNNKIVTLDLNGHTLNRNLTAATDYGHVLTVASGSELIINDSSDNPDTPEYDGTGVIKGAYTPNGGAIDNAGTLIFNAGTIKDNQCTDKGAAIWNRSGATATINGGIITGNNGGSQGGGIMNHGTLTISGNAIISGNKAKDGGGIYNNGTLDISGGSITGNQATSYGGGGISNHGTINMTGGSITGNKSKANGGGIWNGSKLNMQGNPVISGNTGANAANDVYLNGVITVTGAFTEGAHIGLHPSSFGAAATSGYSKYNAGIAPESIFFSNYGKYLELNNDGEVVIYNQIGNWIDKKASSFSHVDGSNYYIENETELALLAYNVNNGTDYQGCTFIVRNDLDLSKRLWTPIGTKDHPFKGTFNGNGHKIIFEFGSKDEYLNQKCALFYCIENATIQNLILDGSIYSSAQYNAGLAVTAKGNNNLIRNCVSRVSINSNKDGDCTNGGFIGILDTNGTQVNFEGCAFAGELLGENASNWGGFVGWRYYEKNKYNKVSFKDCLFAPANVSIATPDGSSSRTFCRSYDSTGASYDNCYYTTVLQEADGGKQGYSFTTAPANIGEAGTDYGMIAAYANGLKYGERYYMAPEAISLADNADNSTLISEKDGLFAVVTLRNRTLYTDGNWNTICLPFDVTLEGSPLKRVEARTLKEATFNDGTLTLNFTDPVKTLTAGTPYIIRWSDGSATEKDGIVSPVFNGVAINAAEPARITPGLSADTEGDGCVTFCGTYDPVTIGEDGDNTKLYFSDNNTLYWPNGAMTINPFRAYFQLNTTAASPAETRSILLNFGNGEVIEIGVNPESTTKGEGSGYWYTLDGRQLDGKPTTKGLYIHNGRKIVIK